MKKIFAIAWKDAIIRFASSSELLFFIILPLVFTFLLAGGTPSGPRANSSAGQLITWVFIPLIGLSGSFAFERQKGTLRRVLTSPTRKATFLFGTIFGQIVLALVQMLLLIGFGMLVLKLNWGRDPLALILILLASALAASALGTPWAPL
jgi:ABC-type transport system involved in cytochrome c biogenesis permease component